MPGPPHRRSARWRPLRPCTQILRRAGRRVGPGAFGHADGLRQKPASGAAASAPDHVCAAARGAANVWMHIGAVPKGFFPEQDTGVIMGGIRALTRARPFRPCRSWPNLWKSYAQTLRCSRFCPYFRWARRGRLYCPQAPVCTQGERAGRHRQAARQAFPANPACRFFCNRRRTS